MDDRKRRVLRAIVTLYGADGEPVGSGLLAEQFGHAVSSATLRNEMAALTKLGLLEQPHTSAGRVPSAKGYRYYIDNLLDTGARLPAEEKRQIDLLFREMDYDPERLAESAARALADLTGYCVVATTPKSEDLCIAHYEVMQVGRYTAAVLAVTNAGGVRTRTAKLDFALRPGDAQRLSQALNTYLTFRSAADVREEQMRTAAQSLGSAVYYPVLSAAVTLLLVPSRVLACLLSRLFPLNSENPAPEELQKKLLPRALVYSLSASVVYLAAYPILNAMFGTSLLTLGIYLPLLVVEPLLTYRFGRVQETLHKAVSKGLRITVGYALLLMLLGCVREWLALGTVFGTPVGQRAVLPMAGMPAGGFIVLGVLCAVWRALAARRKAYLVREARSLVDVHAQKEADGEQ